MLQGYAKQCFSFSKEKAVFLIYYEDEKQNRKLVSIKLTIRLSPTGDSLIVFMY